MAIITHFDLEIKQYDVVNAFIYALRQSTRPAVTCYILNGFFIPGILVEVKQALYGLISSPSL